MDDVLLVLTNMPDQDSAQRMAHSLIENRVAACVNILAPCTSVYRWQDKIESAMEVPMLIKTSRAAYKKLETLIRSQHAYELPEIIAVSIDSGLPAYLQWAIQETSSINEATKE